MKDWVSNLVYELADLEIKCLNLKYFLANNSANTINKGDNMYSEMTGQLTAMLLYKAHLESRLQIIRQRSGDHS